MKQRWKLNYLVNIFRIGIGLGMLLCIIVLALEPLHEYIAIYESPYCSYDRMRFVSENCAKCERTFSESAISSKISNVDDTAPFYELFESYESFNNKSVKVVTCSNFVFFSIGALLMSFIWFDTKGYPRGEEDKKTPKRKYGRKGRKK